jgi:uncharacterized phage-associated protein
MDVIAVAKYFLSLSKPGTDYAITHLKLQKLVYFAQGYFLAIKGRALFQNRLEAWVHGPVSPELYNEYRDFGSKELPPVDAEEIPSDVRKVLDIVWKTYGAYEGEDLEELTHKQDPWIQARGKLKPWQASNNVISTSSIKKYFEQELFGGHS